jgi:AraC family transcriptional regulator
MQFSSIPGKTSAPAATPGVSYEFSAALTNWLAEARLAISHDPRTAELYWDRFEVLLLRNGALERRYDEIEVPSCGLAPWQRARITSYVDANLAKRLSTAELAALVRLSTSHFCRAFKASLGCSPHEYVIQCRIVRAKMLMLETGISLAQIAAECGLADQAHLCRLFRRRVGISPSAWRRGQQLRRVEAPALDHGLDGVSYRFCASFNALGQEKKLTTEPEPSSNRMGAASASLTQEI